ncbi:MULTISPECIES: SIMPL domain-containing protein [unclassified Pseudoalteromonas]|uniref:SIMPL domain-containing protein n=1 Tax=unclassified Pseudoalteromonas TaxID=194690 RepID=UPI000F649F25|nr:MULTISPECIES: SIMPL domain-containing protein [unclassified Pseudoalteromonas]RRS10549.1 SIMPL domain-containing protein [Pseudoalteromonas sp. J010]RXF02397.1 SIMPL domain-containing protein [Pseudoalteromonas sp. PS5]
MSTMSKYLAPAALLSLAVVISSWLIKDTIIAVKGMERTVSVKGLSEQEVKADTVIWPVFYRDADNDLETLVERTEKKNAAIRAFLTLQGFDASELSVSAPSITDKYAQEYGQNNQGFRYVAKAGVTVYSNNPDKVSQALGQLNELAKQGIAITKDDYQNRVEYLFTGLNDIKPEMVQEATQKAREVAVKFAKDSDSVLGKIKSARQGQFSIRDRDSNTPQIKIVRVVTSVEYYLSD